MIRLDSRQRRLAICLSVLAGYVDALGFVGTGGSFVSFMSGNSTRLGLGLVGNEAMALTSLALVTCFVLGVAIASAIGHRAKAQRHATVLFAIAAVLAVAAAISTLAPPLVTFSLVALAMGAENVVFEADGEVRFGLTYMTGTLVKVGQRLAAALSGRKPADWVPFLLLWMGLVAGATVGALVFTAIGVRGLWPAAAAALALGLAARRLPL